MAAYMSFHRSCWKFTFTISKLSSNTTNFFKNQNTSPFCLLSRPMSQWHLVSAVCLERKPIITPELTPVEKEYSQMIEKKEFENSLKSDHELRHEDDLKRTERIKKSEFDDADLEARANTTAQDMEDAATEELNNFQCASRLTEADLADDRKSLQRCLSKHLLFVTREKLGNDFRWLLPHTVRQKNESMRQAAERVFQEFCGDEMKAEFIGNAPVGYYKYKYPKAARTEGIVGAKVFFFKAWYKDGNVSMEALQNAGKDDFLWLTREELNDHLQTDYCKSVKTFLVDESVPEQPKAVERDNVVSFRRAAGGM